jgi:hypothetical protein
VTQKPCAEQDATNVAGAAFFSYSIELVPFPLPHKGEKLESLVTLRGRKASIKKLFQ